MKRTWERRMAEAKAKHRPKLRDWAKDQFATSGTLHAELFQALATLRHTPPVPAPASSTSSSSSSSSTSTSTSLLPLPRIDADSLSTDDFISQFEAPGKPVVLCNTKTTDSSLYSFARLRRLYGSRLFKVGEDDDGYKVKVKFKYFVKYLRANSQQDDSPLYIFDSTFDDDEVAKSILEKYSVPRFFPDDLFSLVGERKRPPYRWWLVGPARSGTCVHIDPLGTSAWNTIIRGSKRWVLFPPDTPKRIAKALDVIKKGEDDEAINYFVVLLPRLRELQKQENFTMIEFTQYQGETVFVPGGWWHAVLNLEDTIAVTQNFCSRTNFLAVWRQTREGRKKMAASWLKRLKVQYPLLAAAAEQANAQDGFAMYTKREREDNTKKSTKATPVTTTTTTTQDAVAAHVPVEAITCTCTSHKHVSKSKMERLEKKRSLAESSALSSATSNESSSDSSVGEAERGGKKRR